MKAWQQTAVSERFSSGWARSPRSFLILLSGSRRARNEKSKNKITIKIKKAKAGRIQLNATLVVTAGLLLGCRRDMMDGSRYKPLEPSGFFADGSSSRPLPAHTIARGELRADTYYFTGRENGQLVNAFPEPVTRAMLERGRERFDIYCSVCHGRTGDGQGMIVRRGFPTPPSFHTDRLLKEPVGHFYEVITNGYGVMYSYANRVEPADRWAIIAYIRALQLSQNATLADVEPEQRAKLEAAPQ